MTIDQTNNNIVDDAVPDEPTYTCDWCNEGPLVRADLNGVTQRYGDSQLICNDCYEDSFNCQSCGYEYHYEQANDMDGSMYCDRCHNNFEWCDHCERYYDGDCPSCEQYGDSRIHDYSFRPNPTFHISRDLVTSRAPRAGVSVTGFELEMEAVECDISDGATLASEAFAQWTYMKHDGSLNNGFELVSHPMSREYAVEVFPWQRLKELADLGMRSANTRTCGLHIHINKGFFANNPTTMYRFMSMFYRNADKWKAIAGRSHSSYANWSEYELDQLLRYTKGLKQRNHIYNNDRYVALNLQNSNTIELRFFKGTLRPESFIARIEAVHAVAEYAQATRNNVSIKSAHDWERFREWTTRNGYTNFNNYAEIKGV